MFFDILMSFLFFHKYDSPWTGFLPKDTALHHRQHILSVLHQALDEAAVDPQDIDVVCYTKGEFSKCLFLLSL